MTYDLAVWEGGRPASDAAASEQFISFVHLLEGDDEKPVSPTIEAFATAVVRRFPVEGVETSGPFAYVTGIHPVGRDADPIALLAVEHGLVCYDPQAEAMVP